MSARYRVLNQDLDAVRAEGAKLGDRDALDALRLGQSHNDWLLFDEQERRTMDAARRAGLDWSACSIPSRVNLVCAFNDAYRTAYGETYYQDEDGAA